MKTRSQNEIDLGSIKYWIFDLDGTLTNPVHDFDAIRSALGLADGVDILNSIARMSLDNQQKLHQKLDAIEVELANRATLSPGAFELLEKLEHKGSRMGILTRNTRKHALIALKKIGLDSFFRKSDVLGRHEAIPKPAPDGILKLLNNWQASQLSSIMVGDYLHDLSAGVAAGTSTVHLDRKGQFAWSELATFQVETLFELAGLV